MQTQKQKKTTAIRVIARIIADSALNGSRITTFSFLLPKSLLAQLNTHRLLSRNAQSSRGIPPRKMLEEVKLNPFIPQKFGLQQKGMQPAPASSQQEAEFNRLWWTALEEAEAIVESMIDAGMSKQYTNRILEPFAYARVVLTAVDLDNFFNLRCAEDTQFELRDVAIAMRDLLAKNTPQETEYHLPYTTEAERNQFSFAVCAKLSAARCARVSYNRLDASPPDFQSDMTRAQQLLSDKHLSPFEHQAIAQTVNDEVLNTLSSLNSQLPKGMKVTLHSGNFHAKAGSNVVWVQSRMLFE